ncbi:MAG: hypothetical protein COS84_10520 [Armatimonadetes bacterium CG07_land_8_20_14_0_80_40_9]|nr:MAG: hypothetical protein COS84_10520 [Armatimonadetes bacterium CG07_land_8_20_14_0_80_40_9]
MKSRLNNNITKYQTKAGYNIYKLPISTPFPVGKVNTYLIEGDGLTLIDTGPYSEKSFGQLLSKLQTLNLNPSDLSNIIITHGHMDHCGLLRLILEGSKAKVFVHKLDADKVSHFLQGYKQETKALSSLLLSSGLDKDKIDILAKAYEYGATFGQEAKVDYKVEEGDILTDLKLRVIHTPGHSDGSICLKLNNYLFSGDNVLENITPNPFAKTLSPYSGLKNFLNSMDKLLNLKDVKLTFPGHGKEVLNLRERIEEVIEHHNQRKEIILKTCQKGRSAYEIATSSGIFRKNLRQELFLAIIEVISHLEVLLEERRVKSSKKGGIVFYQAV